MQPYFNPTRWNMEDDLNFFQNGRRPYFSKVEDDLNFFKMEDDKKKLKWNSITKISSLGCLEQNWGRNSFIEKLGVFHFQKMYVVFHYSLTRLPRTKFRLSSSFKNIEVFFHISSSWGKIRLHTTKNQLPMLSGSALKV